MKLRIIRIFSRVCALCLLMVTPLVTPVSAPAQARSTLANIVTIAISETFSTLDTLTSTASDSSAERLRSLLFNSLVKKGEDFDYVGDLASEITMSKDNRTITFALRENIKFHNGKLLTSADVKYTLDKMFESKGFKSGAFFKTMKRKGPWRLVPQIIAIELPDIHRVAIRLARPELRNQILANLVAIPIIPEGTVEQQKTQPVGSGPFKFVSFDQSENIVELASNSDYFDGAPKVLKVRIKAVTDASALQAELQTGGVDLAPNPSILPSDILNTLSRLPNLKVEQFDGSNIQYVGMNTRSAPLNNVKIRRAIGYAIDRDKMIKELLSGRAKIAHSILPARSWAYSRGTQYNFDPAKSRQLLREAGYKNEPIKFKYASGNIVFERYARTIQISLKEVGLNVEIETLDPGTLRYQLSQGQFQLSTGAWIGGNQDPIFLKDLFTTGRIPGENVACCNRSRYSNPEVDKLIDQAINEIDRNKAKDLYTHAWALISNDLPLLPLWYPANMVVANTRIGNIKINSSGDWTFIKDITLDK